MSSEFLCQRCGTCCRKGGPALHVEDLSLVDSLGLTALVCLRAGEPAYDPRVDALRPLDQEIIKIRGQGQGWTCIFYDSQNSGCRIYTQRPLECRALSCYYPQELFQVMDSPVIQRKDFVGQDSGLWACIQDHEQQFPVSQATALAEKFQNCGQVPEELDDFLRAENAYRIALAQAIEGHDQDLWPYLGRPLWLVLAPYGSIFLKYAP